ncbi:MAG TPA: TatD family hydrolase [Acidimicrobiales bacterium]
MPWFDNHCHLDDASLPGGTEGAIEAARSAGVAGFVTVGTDAARSAANIAIAARHPDVWATVGLHPHDAVNGVSTIVGLLAEQKVVAVGECGLDYYYDHSPRDVQQQAFAEQVELAHQRRLPLVIHTRDAWVDTFAILAEQGVPASTIFHCFTGGSAEARRCLDLGAYLSFSGIVTFKTAVDLREAAALCPADRLLVETDSPYLAPVPHRGRRNQPAYVPLVGACLAEVRGVPVTTIEDCTFVNASVAFALRPS